jgi:hypothetical protein
MSLIRLVLDDHDREKAGDNMLNRLLYFGRECLGCLGVEDGSGREGE